MMHDPKVIAVKGEKSHKYRIPSLIDDDFAYLIESVNEHKKKRDLIASESVGGIIVICYFQ